MINSTLLEMKKIHKRFPGVYALKDVSFSLKAGEVHSLVGENGAGKSTLMNVLMGIVRPDSGEVVLEGSKKEIDSPAFAIRNGIGMVPQELNVVPEITVAENIFMGMPNLKGKMVLDWKATYSEAKKLLRGLGCEIDVRKQARKCTVAQLQMVQIARALAFGARILVFDEPTASLTYQETRELFRIIAQLKQSGAGIIFISHHLEEVMEISDRVSVMRDGELVGEHDIADISIKKMIAEMAGQEVVFSKFNRDHKSEEIVLEVKELTSANYFSNVSFELKKGEILGVGGLVGAGRTETMLAIFGVLPIESGEVIVNGKVLHAKSPKDAIDAGIGYLPEERRSDAIFPQLSIRENITMPILSRIARNNIVLERDERGIVERYIERLEIKAPSGEKKISELSGGNQQKAIFARWIEKDTDILILDEPTRGIDVRAKEEIHKLIVSLADSGKSIILVSSETEELLNISDRIMVMNEGCVKKFLDARTANKNDILNAALN